MPRMAGAGCEDGDVSGGVTSGLYTHRLGRSATRPARALLVAVPVAVVALAGCGTTQDGAVEDTAAQFYAALEDQDGAAACRVLAPLTRSEVEQAAKMPCEDAILEQGIAGGRGAHQVSAFGTAAQVRYDGETAFLSRYRDGWFVVAAGCTPQPGDRYDCQVEAG